MQIGMLIKTAKVTNLGDLYSFEEEKSQNNINCSEKWILSILAGGIYLNKEVVTRKKNVSQNELTGRHLK